MTDFEEKYNKLLQEHLKLKNDYSENTIIESMNDMKKVYERQQKKIDKLKNIIDNIIDINKTLKVMLSVLCRNTSSYNYDGRYELKHRIEFIQEILNNSLKLKSEVYYLDLGE